MLHEAHFIVKSMRGGMISEGAPITAEHVEALTEDSWPSVMAGSLAVHLNGKLLQGPNPSDAKPTGKAARLFAYHFDEQGQLRFHFGVKPGDEISFVWAD